MRKFKFAQSQKFRVIVNKVSVYVTAKQIRDQFGDVVRINDAVVSALSELQKMHPDAVGLCGRWQDVDVQIDACR